MNLLAQRLRRVFPFRVFFSPPREPASFLEPDTDLERYLFCRDLRSSGPPRR